jgi:hypothetical protein
MLRFYLFFLPFLFIGNDCPKEPACEPVEQEATFSLLPAELILFN